MSWFLHDLARAELERSAIERLQSGVTWLVSVGWTITEDGKLAADVEIEAHENLYHVRMIYPVAFPEAPPFVKPSNPDEHWSSHQYRNGTLCLEWGPDNWHKSLTGAQMLESTYHLLDIENPRGGENADVLPSRHSVSIGQELRNFVFLFLASSELRTFLLTLPNHSIGTMEYMINYHQNKTLAAYVTTLTPEGGDTWKDQSLPDGLLKGKSTQGIFYRTDLSPENIRGINTPEDLIEAIRSAGIDPLVPLPNTELTASPPSSVLIAGADGTTKLFFPRSSEPTQYYNLKTFDISTDIHKTRMPGGIEALGEKKVGIVGLGSIGSKMSVSLARTGVKDFVLCDDDVFQPGNVCRHSLDWRNVGEHKVHAIAQTLSYIAPSINVETFDVNLTGQESTSYVSKIQDRLGACDLLIDSTANADIFNIISALAVTRSIPMVWMEVFVGGVGGLVARYSPNHDPDPKIMRQAYLQFSEDNPFPDTVNAGEYAGEDTDGQPMVATDADVSIIADHATHFVIDSLLHPENSEFPFSLYLVGLRKYWVFKAPFHTIQIPTEPLKKTEVMVPSSPEMTESGRKFILGILEKTDSDKDS